MCGRRERKELACSKQASAGSIAQSVQVANCACDVHITSLECEIRSLVIPCHRRLDFSGSAANNRSMTVEQARHVRPGIR